MKMFYWFLGFAIVCLFIFWSLRSSQNKEAGMTALPQQFNHYQSLDSLREFRSGGTTMTLLLESIEEIQSFLSKNDEIVVYTVPDKNVNSFYKLNKDGTIVDSLTLQCRPTDIIFVKGFIIDKEKRLYYKWSFDGNKEAININTLNEGLNWDMQKQQKQLAAIIKNSSAVYIDYEFKSPEPQKPAAEGEIQAVPSMQTYTILTYFIDNDCFRFSTTLNTNKDFPYSYTEKLLLNNLFKRINTKVSGNKEIIKTPQIHYRYFQKLKLEKVRFSGGGGNAAPFDEMLFHGNLFTDVVYRNDTLKLREFMYLNEDWHQSDIEIEGQNIGTLTKNKAQPPANIDAYMYYTNPQLNYALFTSNDKKLYIIK